MFSISDDHGRKAIKIKFLLKFAFLTYNDKIEYPVDFFLAFSSKVDLENQTSL